MKKENYLIKSIFYLIYSCIIGLVIGLFQVAILEIIKQYETFWDKAITNKNLLMIIFIPEIVIIVLIFLYHLLFLKKDYETTYKGKLHNCLLNFVQHFALFLVGYPVSFSDVGTKFGGSIHRIITTSDNEEEIKDDTMLYQAGAFGGLFISPLAGIGEYVESKKYKFNILSLIKILFISFIIASISYAIKIPFGLETALFFDIKTFEEFSWNSLILYFGLGIIIFLLFLGAYYLHSFLLKSKNKKWFNTFQIFVTVLLVIISSIILFLGFYLNYEAWPLFALDGMKLLPIIYEIKKAWWVITLMFVWFIYVMLLPVSKFKTGVTFPLIFLGALIGLIFVQHGVRSNLINNDEGLLLILISMFSIYGVFNKKPLTAILLIIPCLNLHALVSSLIPMVLMLFPGISGAYLLKMKGFDELIKEYN